VKPGSKAGAKAKAPLHPHRPHPGGPVPPPTFPARHESCHPSARPGGVWPRANSTGPRSPPPPPFGLGPPGPPDVVEAATRGPVAGPGFPPPNRGKTVGRPGFGNSGGWPHRALRCWPPGGARASWVRPSPTTPPLAVFPTPSPGTVPGPTTHSRALFPHLSRPGIPLRPPVRGWACRPEQRLPFLVLTRAPLPTIERPHCVFLNSTNGYPRPSPPYWFPSHSIPSPGCSPLHPWGSSPPPPPPPRAANPFGTEGPGRHGPPVFGFGLGVHVRAGAPPLGTASGPVPPRPGSMDPPAPRALRGRNYLQPSPPRPGRPGLQNRWGPFPAVQPDPRPRGAP